MEPGWVPTRMGGRGAPDNLDEGTATQNALVTPNSPLAELTGKYVHQMTPVRPSSAAQDESLQNELLVLCQRLSCSTIL